MSPAIHELNLLYATLYWHDIYQDIRYAIQAANQVFENLQETSSGLKEGTDASLKEFVEVWLRTAGHDLELYIKSYNLARDGREDFNLRTWRENFDPDSTEYKHRGSDANLHKTIRNVMSEQSEERKQIRECIHELD